MPINPWNALQVLRRRQRRQEDEPQHAPQPATLDQLAFALLDDPASWRERAVEQIKITDALWSERERKIDVQPLNEVKNEEIRNKLAAIDTVTESGQVSINLPLSRMAADPLFEFSMTVNGIPVSRIPRRATAQFQARYVMHLVESAQLDDDELPELSGKLLDFLIAMFGFTSGSWMAKRKTYYSWAHWVKGFKRIFGKVNPTKEYIDAILGPRTLTHQTFHEAKVSSDAISEIVCRHVLSSRKSATQNPLLVVPHLLQVKNFTHQDVVRTLGLLYRLLETAHDKGARPQLEDPPRPPKPDERAAKILAESYSAYGRRWEGIATCWVPITEPFSITVRDKRLVHFDSPSYKGWVNRNCSRVYSFFFSRARYNLEFADASSNHIHISIPDAGAQLAKRSSYARNDIWEKLPNPSRVAGAPDSEDKDHEYYSRYDRTPNRPGRIWIQCRLKQAKPRSIMSWGVLLATVAAWVLVMNFGVWDFDPTARMNGGDVLALLFPVTLAASLLLARESSTLSMRVKRMKQFLLMLALAVLWATTVWLYFTGRVSIDGLYQRKAFL